MKISHCLLVLILILSTNAVGATEVTFATFNTFWLFDDKAPHKKWWTDQRGKTGQTYPEAIAAVAEAIKETGADVIALQEIESMDVANDLNTHLKTIGVDYPHAWIGLGSDSTTGQDVALLSKFPKDGLLVQKYPNDRESYLTENDAGNERDTGLSKVLRVDLKINGEVLSVLVFHLKAQPGGSMSDNQRLAQASIIRRITLPLIHDEQKFVVMGDMNADRGSPSLLRMRGFDDVYPDLTQPVHHKKFSGDKWTYKYHGRTTQIDHILLSPTLRKSIKEGSIDYSHDEMTSDHFPVILTLDL